jgi:hypothetical protein
MDGIERYATDIIAENMQMLGGPLRHGRRRTLLHPRALLLDRD